MKDLDGIKVSATIIVISRDRKVLIVQRRPDEAFPNLWTVSGGKLKEEDGERITETFYYHPVEDCARRELFEETGIHIWYMPIRYLDSIYTSELKRLILSFFILMDKDAKDLKITLSPECQAYKWITEKQIKGYKFIPDIGGEIRAVFNILNREREIEIKRIIHS